MRGTTVRRPKKRHSMWKIDVSDIRAALKLIAAANANALKALLRNVAGLFSKSVYSSKKA